MPVILMGNAADFQDFNTYTEVDPNSRITVATSKVTASGVTQQEDAYVYKDFGVSYFNALNIDFEAYIDSTGGNNVNNLVSSGLTSATVNDGSGWAATDVGVGFQYADAGGGNIGRIYLIRGALVANDSFDGIPDTLYYLTLLREAANDTIELKIYSDSSRSTLLDTLSVAGYGAATRYRYLYPLTSYNSGDAGRSFVGYTQNMVIY
jgi:hypothetical protein